MMNSSKLLRLSFCLMTRYSRLSGLTLTQVTRSSNFTHFNPAFLPPKPFSFHQNAFFSSKPQSLVDLVLSSDSWSGAIEKELDKISPDWTHVSVSYVLMSLNANPQKSLDFFNWVCAKKGFVPSFTPYVILLWSLASKEFLNEFWKIFTKMMKKGFYVNSKVYSTINAKFFSEGLNKVWTQRYRQMVDSDYDKNLAKAVLDLILSNDWGEEVEVELRKKLRFPLKESFLLRLIAELWPQPLKGLKFFEWIGSCGGYKHDIVTYNAMAQVLAVPNSVSEFWDFVKRMRSEGYEIDIYTYVRCSKPLPDKDAVELFELMMDGPYQPPLLHTSSLLSKITRDSDPDLDLVYRVFNKIVGTGNGPSKADYDCVHRALCNLGKFDEAKKIVENSRNSSYKPDNLTYGQEIAGLCKAGKFVEACKVLEQMEVEGCVPNVKTWTILLEGLCEANQVDQALSWFQKMKEKDVSPSPDTLFFLIIGFISENRVLDAYRFLNELLKKEYQLRPRQDTCRLMIEKLAEAGKLKEASSILSLMKKHNYRLHPDPITQYISKFGTVDDAKRFLKELSPSVSSSVTVYGKLVEAFIEEGRYSAANGLVLASPPHVRRDKGILDMLSSGQAPPLVKASKG